MNDALNALSPLDGRYHDDVAELQCYFSEGALLRYQVIIEIEYLIAFHDFIASKKYHPINQSAGKKLRLLYQNFTEVDAREIKKIESTTKHDLKAVEYFIKNKMRQYGLSQHLNFVHFALTSEDIKNLAFSLAWQEGLSSGYLPVLNSLNTKIVQMAKKHKSLPMLSMTHGQSATPTTLGKELAVFASRLKRQIKQLMSHRLLGKLSGATGTWGAHTAAFPNKDWINFSQSFIKSLGFEPNLLTTQIEPHDSLVESYQIVFRINSILLDLVRDMWLYISRGIFAQANKSDEIGSSAMPHKINPINFENAEGNLGLANALLHYFAEKLPISRLQRDLSDSTVLRNQGAALGYSLLACKSILQGLSRIRPNTIFIREDLDAHWEVLTEAIQTVLKKYDQESAYEKLKKFSRGKTITKQDIAEFINKTDLSKEAKQALLNLTPHNYIGLCEKCVSAIM